MFLDLVNLVLKTTWYTFNSQFYQQTDDVPKGGKTSSLAEIYMEAHEHTATSTAILLKKFGNNFLMTFILFFNLHTRKVFSIT